MKFVLFVWKDQKIKRGRDDTFFKDWRSNVQWISSMLLYRSDSSVDYLDSLLPYSTSSLVDGFIIKTMLLSPPTMAYTKQIIKLKQNLLLFGSWNQIWRRRQLHLIGLRRSKEFWESEKVFNESRGWRGLARNRTQAFSSPWWRLRWGTKEGKNESKSRLENILLSRASHPRRSNWRQEGGKNEDQATQRWVDAFALFSCKGFQPLL